MLGSGRSELVRAIYGAGKADSGTLKLNGQDISVGAIMAVAAADCCQILSGGVASTNDFQNPFILAALAGFAGLVNSSRIYSADANNIGLNLEMGAILAVALGGNLLSGGKFSLAGSIIGAFTIQALTATLLSMNVSADQIRVYKAMVVVVILVLQNPVFKKQMAVWKARKGSNPTEGGRA